eukprot:SAG31_NODE_33280_length_345_cov_1.471545_1_plen_39_part_10
MVDARCLAGTTATTNLSVSHQTSYVQNPHEKGVFDAQGS